MERVPQSTLLDILDSFDKKLGKTILLIAVGGTAMTLLGWKASTKDIDFNIPYKDDLEEFKRVKKLIEPGVKIDLWGSNMIFSEALPEDYIEMSSEYKIGKFSKINIKILSPIDIVCSKISRFNEADEEDIKDCIKHARLTEKQLVQRIKQYSRVGSDNVFKQNSDFIIQNMFN